MSIFFGWSLVTALFLLLNPLPSASASNADETFLRNWPQWRGPTADGVAPLANPPLEWNEKKNVKWKAPIPGFGASTPVVWENQVFIQTAAPTGKKVAQPQPAGPPGGGPGGRFASEAPQEVYQWILLSYDRANGNILWKQVAREEVPHEGHHRDHGFASASPVTDGDHIIAFFGSRGVYCYDMKGNLQWEKDLGRMQTRLGFGEGASPALSGNVVVINWDHEGEGFIVALDKRDGRELWRNARDEPSTWATPLIVTRQGKQQAVTSGANKIRSYDLETGQLIWEASGMTQNVIPTPVHGFGNVYALSGFRGNSLMAIRLGHTGDLTGTDAVAWTHDRNTPYVPSPLLSEERLYFFSGNNALLSCFHATAGRPLFEAQRVDGMFGVYASPAAADGRVYLLGRDGGAVVIKDADQFEVLATNKLEDNFDASPALAGKDLFLRGHQYLYCISE